MIKLCFAAIVLSVCTGYSIAQETDRSPFRLTSGVAENGFIGGEAHDAYVIKAIKGQKMTVEISWKEDEGNRAEFSVSTSASFFDGESVGFGEATEEGTRWTGKIPETADYFIYVVAHPSADYTIKVRLN
ncbi:MAG: hypothetical protein R2681_03825 [Pyrinomonadaceae bacterium]